MGRACTASSFRDLILKHVFGGYATYSHGRQKMIHNRNQNELGIEEELSTLGAKAVSQQYSHAQREDDGGGSKPALHISFQPWVIFHLLVSQNM